MYHTEEVDAGMLEHFEEVDDTDLDGLESRVNGLIKETDFWSSMEERAEDADAPSIVDITFQTTGVDGIYGAGWQANLRACMRDYMEDCEEEVCEFDDPSLHSLVDDVDAIALSVQKQMRAQTVDVGENENIGFELLSSLDAKELIIKIIARNRRSALHKASESEAVATARRALAGGRGRAPCLTSIERLHPDIGDKVDVICADMDIGADAHRRDGILTLDSATRRTKGSGYVRIANELQKRHGISLSSREVQYLGLARRKRSRTNLRYKALSQMKYRRSVKRVGEENLDTRAARAFYRIVHHVRDRCSQSKVTSLERDDHSRIRPNSSSTTNQHPVVAVGVGPGAVQHDYNDQDVCSSFYITSMRGAKMADGVEVNIAIVKIDKREPSTPSQHAADMYMLQDLDDARAKTLFRTPDGGYKSIEHLEVDGGPDEDPSRMEVRFLQTERAMGGPLFKPEQRRAQVGATTRAAGDTALNVVERLNGQETETIATFHAATDACGSLLDDVSGKVDQGKVESMWCHHADRLTALLNGSSGLNGSTVLAVRGATAASCEEARILLERRPVLVDYIKPNQSKKRKQELEKQYPVLVAHIEKVLAFQLATETSNLYTSTVNTASRDSYPREGVWFEGGPKLKAFPPPYLDPARPGHRMCSERALSTYASQGYTRKDLNNLEFQWPSEVAEMAFERFTLPQPLQRFPEERIDETVARINDSSIDAKRLRAVFLHYHYVRLHRMEGARKAAATRKKNTAERKAAADQKAAAEREAARSAAVATRARAKKAAAQAKKAAAPVAAAPPAARAARQVARKTTDAPAKRAAVKKAAVADEPSESESESESEEGSAEESGSETDKGSDDEVVEQMDDDFPSFGEPDQEQAEMVPPTSKWLDQMAEVQDCDPEECDFICGKCAWTPCQVNAPYTILPPCVSLISLPLLFYSSSLNSSPTLCQVLADDGWKHCKIVMKDGEVLEGIAYRFLRMPQLSGAKRTRGA